jgi:predicted ATPase/DNA-binding SARP family transcriptional activator
VANGTVAFVEFAVLGPVLVDGRPPRGAIERALLARLLIAPGAPVATGELVEAAWPEERRAAAAGSLRVRLAKLRALLEPDRERGAAAEVLVREPAGYRLVVAPERVDAARFARLAEEASRLAPAAALDRCEEALELWRGEPFADLDLVEVAAAEARRLHGMRIRLRHMHALALLELGRADEAAQELAALLADDPLREELVRDLMRARYRAGRQAEALDAYRELARRLAELGLTPGPEVRETEALVLRHADELAGTAPARSRAAQLTNVGARVASVVGREVETAAVADALGEHRIVTLVGPGGVGKTTLAGEVARAQQERFADGAWFVELAPLRDAAEVLPAVATTLGLKRIGGGVTAGDRDAQELVRERLHDARALVVLDGAEHLLPGVGAAARELAAAGGGVHVLVTSRRAVGLAGEAVIAVPPLAVPAGPEAVEASPAGRLFLERARAARPDWRLGDEETAAVARICRRLDGLPLALELAASRLRALSATTIAERLDEGLAVLGRGTLDASIDASHGLLAPDEQELFRRLSVFEGAFGLEDAEEVASGEGLARERVLELLIALTEHSMVQAEGEAPRRYRMLESLRVDAAARLDEAAASAAAGRHAVHLARVAGEAAARVGPEGAEAAGDPLVPWHADLEAAFRYALDRQDADLALDLAAGFGALHHRYGTVPRGIERLEQALALSGGEPSKRFAALWWHVPLLLCELRVDDALAALEQARVLVPEPADPVLALGIRSLEGQVELCRGNLAAAGRALDGVADALARRGEWFTAGHAAWGQGTLALMRGALDEAVPQLTAARDYWGACNDVCSVDGVTAELVEAALIDGREREAIAACEYALSLAPERPLAERNTHLLHEAALIAARAGRPERAALLAAAADVASRRDPVATGPWHAPAAAGDLALMAGDLVAARESYQRALGLAESVHDRAGPSMPASMYLLASRLRLAQVAGAEGDREGALVHARVALEHGRASGAPVGVAAAQAALAQLEAPAAVAPR